MAPHQNARFPTKRCAAKTESGRTAQGLLSSLTQTVLLSLKTASVGTFLMFPVALFLASLLHRPRFRGQTIVEAFIMSPLVLPPVVTGYFLLLLFGRKGIFGEFLGNHFAIHFTFDWKGAALASAIVALPLMVRSFKAALQNIDPQLLEAAKDLGADSRTTFLRIAFPLARSGIVSGLFLGLARALGEFGATMTFAGNIDHKTRTLPLAIYTTLQRIDTDHELQILVSASLALTLFAVFLSERLQKVLEP